MTTGRLRRATAVVDDESDELRSSAIDPSGSDSPCEVKVSWGVPLGVNFDTATSEDSKSSRWRVLIDELEGERKASKYGMKVVDEPGDKVEG